MKGPVASDWRIASAPSADLPAHSFLPQLRRVWDDGRVNHEQRAASGQSRHWRAGQSRDRGLVTWHRLGRHWWDVTRNWPALPGPGASQLGPDCYVMTTATGQRGNTGHRETGTQNVKLCNHLGVSSRTFELEWNNIVRVKRYIFLRYFNLDDLKHFCKY